MSLLLGQSSLIQTISVTFYAIVRISVADLIKVKQPGNHLILIPLLLFFEVDGGDVLRELLVIFAYHLHVVVLVPRVDRLELWGQAYHHFVDQRVLTGRE